MIEFGLSSKRRFFLLTGFLVAFLVILNTSTFLLYSKAKSYLDDELGERLRSIAVTLARAMDTASPASLDAIELDPDVLSLLVAVKSENLLSNVVVLTESGRTVIDLSNVSQPGESNPFIDLDYSAVTLARSGIPAYTRLYKAGDIFMKSAYAPIGDQGGEVYGLVGVEAGASFFDVLRALGNLIWVINGAGVVITVVMGVFLYRQSLSLDRAQAAVIRGENLATMGRMVAGIAHEIRNPLSIIRTSGEVLQRKFDDGDDAFKYILEEVDKLNRILTGYLNFARAEAQAPAPQSLERIVRRCALIIGEEAAARAVDVVTRIDQGDVEILGDDKRVQQALLNVLINAVQAVDRGGHIEIAVERQGGFGVVAVTDNGRGIPRRILKDVTRPFFTTKERGSGLGMSIVRNIVEEHNGKLDIRSVEGQGTTVSLALPLAGTHHR